MGCRGCSLASTLSRFIVSRSLFLQPFPPCSPNIFPLPFPLPRPSPLFLSLSLQTYSVFSSPRPIYLPPRVAEWILFVSHRYFSGPACRSSSKTVSPPRFMFPPTQRRIDPFLLSDVYVCGSVFLPHISSPFCGPFRFPAHARARISRAHDCLCPRSSRTRWSPCPLASASFETSFQRFCHPSPSRSLFFFL